jgi:ribosomal protein S18 acetylase RimI-like enzyme
MESGVIRLVELAGAALDEDAILRATLVTWPGRGPAFNHVTRLRWSDLDWRRHADLAAGRLEAMGELPVLDVAEGLAQPADLAARLVADGWLEVGGEEMLWTRRAAAVPHLDLDLRLEAVTARRVDEYETVERAIFGVNEAERDDRRSALRRTLGAGLVRAYLVRVGGEAVGTGRLLVEDGVAVIHGLGVAESRRRAGIGRYLTTIVTRAGLAMGASLVWLAVDPQNTAAMALYGGLDYRPAFRRRRLLGPA